MITEEELQQQENYVDEKTLARRKELLKRLLEGNSSTIQAMDKNTTHLEGRDEVIADIYESMHKKRMKNIILLGEPGCGKTAIIECFAYKYAKEFTILNFSLPGAVAGTKYRGEFEEKINGILRLIMQYNNITPEKPIVLFIDEIHTLYKAGGAEGAIDASNILKPYLASGKIIIIGATTKDEYKNTLQTDGAMARRLGPIEIPVLDKKVVLKILKNFSEKEVSKELLEYIYERASKIEGGVNPDISIEVLDRCMARSVCRKVEITKEMIDNIADSIRLKETSVYKMGIGA